MAAYVEFDGTSAANVRTADHSSLDITGNLQIIVGASFDVAAAANYEVLLDKGDVGSAGGAFTLRRHGFGTRHLEFVFRTVDGAIGQLLFFDATPATPGAFRWYKLEFNSTSSPKAGTLYYSDQSADTAIGSITWTVFGTDTDTATGSLSTGTFPLWLGNRSDTTASPLDGRIYYAELRNGIGGTVVADPDFRDADQASSSTQFIDTLGRVWTLGTGAVWSGVGSTTANFASFDGSSGQGVSTPDHASLDITGNLQIIMGVAFTNVTETTDIYGHLISKWDDTAQSSFILRRFLDSRDLEFVWRDSGGTTRTIKVDNITPTVAGQFRWYKLEFNVATATGTFYFSDQGPTTAIGSITWTNFGSATLSLATSIFSGSVAVWLGNRPDNPTGRLNGKIYYAELRNGIGGTLVANPDFRDADQITTPNTVFTDDQGRVWTFTGAAIWSGETVRTITWRPFDLVSYWHRGSVTVDFTINLPTFDFVVDGDLWVVGVSGDPPPPFEEPPPIFPLTPELLTSLALQITAGLELLDQNDVVLADISDDLETGVVARNMNATIHGTARLRLARAVNWHNQRLRPYITLTELITGTSERFDLGIYLPETPSRQTGRTPATYDVEAYDKLVILDHPHGIAFTANAGVRVVATVEALLDGRDLPHSLDQTSTATVPSARSWPLDEQNTTLRIINDLLASINYRALYVDRSGIFRSEPYRAPAERAPIWHYDASSPRTTIAEVITEEVDLFSIPNFWVFVRDDPAQAAPSEGDGVYTVTNPADGISSINSRGRVITKVERVDAADHASLVAYGNQIVQRDRQPFAHLTFTAVPNPLHWHADSVTVTSDELGLGNVIFGEQAWSLPLDGGDMTHEVRRSVQV